MGAFNEGNRLGNLSYGGRQVLLVADWT